MSRLPWRRLDADEPLDPELTALLATSARTALGPTPAQLARARARLDAALATPDATPRLASRGSGSQGRGGLRRRLAFGALGGGGLWATAVGAAAAHQVAAVVVGAALVVGGAVAAERSGVDEAVREAAGDAVGITAQAFRGGDDARESDSIGPPADSNSPVRKEDGGEEVPGNLSVREKNDGGYSLRSVLESVDTAAGTVAVSIVGEEAPLALPLALGAKITGQGIKQHTATIEDLVPFEGHLVRVEVECDDTADGLTAVSCEITTLHVLGNAGQADKAPKSAEESDAPGNSGAAPGHADDAPGNSGDAPGQSDDAPGNSGNAPGQSKDKSKPDKQS